MAALLVLAFVLLYLVAVFITIGGVVLVLYALRFCSFEEPNDDACN